MSYQFENKKIKSRLIGHKTHLVIRTEDGREIDHLQGNKKGIKRASTLERLSFQGKRVVLDGKSYILKNKSLNKYLIRNGTRLTFDRYGSRILLAASRGFDNAIRFIPRKGLSKAEMRGKMLLKCVEHYCNPSCDGVHFPYDEDPTLFKKNYRDAMKWEQFFICLWKLEVKR